MIESRNDASKNLEKALQALQQAKQRVANEKKKQNEKKRKAEVTYSPRLRGAPFGEQVSLAWTPAEGVVCLATAKSGNDNSPSQAAPATLQ